MKKRPKILISAVLALVIVVSAWIYKRENDREMGTAHGYTTGYSIGYSDFLQGKEQIGTKLAGEIVPYEVGSGKWKYFMMGFIEGYEDGFSGENLWYTDES